jgi:L-fuconolactonase
MKIDSHQHFWNYSAEDYPWIGADMKRLARDYLPADLEAVARPEGVAGSVAVQARQSLAESRWLLELTERHPFIRGVVGWVDLRNDRVADDLAMLAPHEKFVGVRHVVQDEPDPRFLLTETVVSGIRHLHQFGLTYDLLLYPHQLPAAVELAGLLPEQPFVLDHLAKPGLKPPINAGDRDPCPAPECLLQTLRPRHRGGLAAVATGRLPSRPRCRPECIRPRAVDVWQ